MGFLVLYFFYFLLSAFFRSCYFLIYNLYTFCVVDMIFGDYVVDMVFCDIYLLIYNLYILTYNLLIHTHNLLTHNLLTYNLHTHNLLTHNLLTHNLYTYNFVIHRHDTWRLRGRYSTLKYLSTYIRLTYT